MPAIPLTTPSVTPASSEKVFGEIWVPYIQILAQDANQECRVIAQIASARTLPDGSKELSPDAPKTYVCDNWFEKCATDPRAAQVMGMLLMLLKEYAEV